MPTQEEIRALTEKVVSESKATPDMIYHGYMGVPGMHTTLVQELANFSIQSQTSAEKIEYANMLFANANFANKRKVNIWLPNASRDYFNADLLFVNALKAIADLDTTESKKLKAQILIEQANFYASITKDKSGFLDEIKKTPAEIREMYKKAGEIAKELKDPALENQASAGLAAIPEKKAEELKALLEKFIKIATYEANPHLIGVLADVKIVKNDKGGHDLLIDPNAIRGASFLVEGMLTKATIDGEVKVLLGLEKGVDFSIEKHTVRTDKFILHEDAFDKCTNAINEKLELYESRKKASKSPPLSASVPPTPSITPASVSPTPPPPPAPPLTVQPAPLPSTPISSDKKEEVKIVPVVPSSEKKEEVKIAPVPPPKASFISGRTPPIGSDALSRINILNWERGASTEKDVTRFVQPTTSNFIDVNKSKHQISSNDTSLETFKAMLDIFQKIYGPGTSPMFTLDNNTPQNRENCKQALQAASYSTDQIDKIMKNISSTAAPAPPAPVDSGAYTPPPSRRM